MLSFQDCLAIVSFTDSGFKMSAPFLALSFMRLVLVLIVLSFIPLRLQSSIKLTKIS